MSSRTRSGWSSCTAATAASPFSASPTTSYPSASRSVLALARKLGWSSTIRTVTPIVSSLAAVGRIRLPTLFLRGCHRLCTPFLAPLDGRGGRNLDVEDGAAAAVGLDPDPAFDPPDQLPGDVEAEPGASDAAGHVGIEAIELFEDATPLRRRDTEAAVRDRKPDDVACGLHRDADLAAAGRVLDGVLDQIVENLAELRLVRGHARQLDCDRLQLEADAFGQMRPGGLQDARG